MLLLRIELKQCQQLWVFFCLHWVSLFSMSGQVQVLNCRVLFLGMRESLFSLTVEEGVLYITAVGFVDQREWIIITRLQELLWALKDRKKKQNFVTYCLEAYH
eukprot:TRINITY_DN82933_c0_g1_i7.p5 TRINITY_DN82933_c0_g1~~TRINITY_DN82933_c0_g1_i7.p5  ORF type:complete len:103 (+),score=7.31 TRINITY_DN82933_c0_g1_i7:1047-1355(+)